MLALFAWLPFCCLDKLYAPLLSLPDLCCNMLCLYLGWEDPYKMDRSGGHLLQKVFLCQRRVELRHRHVGSDVLWGAALLGDVQSRCEQANLQMHHKY